MTPLRALCPGCMQSVKVRSGGTILGEHHASWQCGAPRCWASGMPVAPAVNLTEAQPLTRAGERAGWERARVATS